ncbi:hypothetical protein [Mongoliitalea daihaiensis]|uniref:hypothetical protein n=1 Tax=Mongoliitalea daihaiensis TaxID=2782006 RepID=UPI001F25A43E|nr:hypothetical protein [Mongoliitalea daihaiensis]UJP65106.1 hypothetical protein IPZ59_00235 [Mongoliitalea daihaiensis]
MKLKDLDSLSNNLSEDKVAIVFAQFSELLKELKTRDLTENLISLINLSVDKINASTTESKQLKKLIKQEQNLILKQLEKEMKVVPINYYRNLWLVLGMTTFGLPMGVSIGLSLGNIGLLGIGLPIGMVIGMAVGSNIDKKALKEGRQLNFEVKS